MKSPAERTAGDGPLAALGFEPDSVLVNEPRVLLDSQFLGSLHAELEKEMGPEQASVTLLQMGFVHGLRDALRVSKEVSLRGEAADAPPVAPALAIRLDGREAGTEPKGLEVRGSWPERHEASARLGALGPSRESACFVSNGYTSGWLSGILDADVLVIEVACSATGAEACRFVAREAAAWRREGEPEVQRLLDALPFAILRELARAQAGREAAAGRGELESAGSVIHIWGPVMVIPFIGAEEALRALELIGRDPDAREVSVVVLDLSDALLDEAFDTLAIEQIVERAEAWGAETLVATVSPLAVSAIETLDRQPIVVHKDLHQAIACAFQIAESQRRLV